METLISLLVQIISGAVGGNLAGMTKQSLGTGLNTLLGGVGGLMLGQLASVLTGTSGGEALDVAAVGPFLLKSADAGAVRRDEAFEVETVVQAGVLRGIAFDAEVLEKWVEQLSRRGRLRLPGITDSRPRRRPTCRSYRPPAGRSPARPLWAGAAWLAQELLSTFADDLGKVSLAPATGGAFRITCDGVQIWERKADGGFPEAKVLKQRVRDQIDPQRDLGHNDRTQ